MTPPKPKTPSKSKVPSKSKKPSKAKRPSRPKAPSKTKKPSRPKAPRLGARKKPAPARLPENPRAKALAQRIAALVLDKKAQDILILDVRGKASYADYVVLASGESERQVSAMAEHVEVKLKVEGTRPVGTEGYDTGRWVLLDYGEVVAHLFFTEVRAFYDLEGLWADAPREKVA